MIDFDDDNDENDGGDDEDDCDKSRGSGSCLKLRVSN